MNMTSAYANKLLRQLEDDKVYWMRKERDSYFYDAAEGEVPVIPEYDYQTVSATIDEIDKKVGIIKHALNIANSNAQVEVGDEIMSVDQILIRMSQLNMRRSYLDMLRKQQPKERIQLRSLGAGRNNIPEYRYINYDLDLVKQDYETIAERIMIMQIALDKYNQTVEFDVPI